jgi:hypothetical protein
MSLSFPKLGPCFSWWGGPMVRAGRPRPASQSKNQAAPQPGRPARGRPRTGASAPQVILCRSPGVRKLSDIGQEVSAPTSNGGA